MPHVPSQNGQPMHLSGRCYRNVIKARLMGTSVIKDLTGGMRACQIKWQ